MRGGLGTPTSVRDLHTGLAEGLLCAIRGKVVPVALATARQLSTSLK